MERKVTGTVGRSVEKNAGEARREARLKAALRANLQRRKAQARARGTDPAGGGGEEKES